MGELSKTFHFKHFIEESRYCYPEKPKYCIICEKYIPSRSVHFRCRDCKFYFHKGCPTISLESNHTIYHPKTHEHTLTFVRKMNTFSCAACGEVYNEKMNMYGCLQCNFFVHRNCIYLPKVIKLTSHRHRLFQTFQFLDFKNCRICDKPVVYECGGYTCIDKSCDYKLHSYCATRKEIWDGKDVEREPEEINNSEDVASSSLVEVDDKTSRHFSHHHDLMRIFVSAEVEDGRVCQACILPIDFGSFFGCKECDFALHETCASLPRKMEHSLHRHPLTLEVNMMNIKEGFFCCSKCGRESCGFMYQCYQKECEFKMDAKCASLSDPLYIRGHGHPLNLLDSGARCDRCGSIFNLKHPSLPVLVKYEYDTHPLTLCFPKSFLWMWLPPLYCQICEVKIKHRFPDSESFYGCTDCNTILCVECAIGKYPYLKPGITIRVNGFEIEITSNSLSRPICDACHCTCQDKLVFKNKRDARFFCSIKCITLSSLKTLSAKIN